MNTPHKTHLSPAKINLTLHITGRRNDGYHLLDSLVVFSDIADTITLTPTHTPHDVTLSVGGTYGDNVPTGDDNLILRAVHAIQNYAHDTNQTPTQGVHIDLTKNLPVSAGVGGGSANCAVILNELPLLWNIAISDLDRDTIGKTLGADVMICTRQATTRMQGVGDMLNPIALAVKKLGVVLINPNIPLSTAEVFAHYHTQREQGLVDYTVVDDHWDISPLNAVEMVRGGWNDLQGSAVSLCPQIGDVLHSLGGVTNGLCHGMSGSGATCFALFDNRQQADTARQTLHQHHPDWWVASGEIL